MLPTQQQSTPSASGTPRLSSVTWWVLQPITGLAFLDSYPTLARGVRIAFVSKEHIPFLVGLLEANRTRAVTFDRAAELTRVLERGAGSRVFHSFVAVSYTGRKPNPSRHDEAVSLARDVAALLTVVLFAYSRYASAPGLSALVSGGLDGSPDLSIPRSFLRFDGAGFGMHAILSAPIQMLQGDLRQILALPTFQCLTAIMSGERPMTPLAEAVRAATRRLAQAVHDVSLSGQILGAVTALEILLAGESAPRGGLFPHLRYLTARLVGPVVAKQFKLWKVFDARHRYVHAGREAEKEDVARGALILGVYALVHAAYLAELLGDKRELERYLETFGNPIPLTCADRVRAVGRFVTGRKSQRRDAPVLHAPDCFVLETMHRPIRLDRAP